MSNRIELDNGTVIVKSDDGTWTIESWVTTELADKEGQVISVNELMKDVPIMMADNPMVTLGHKDTPLGPIVDVQKKQRIIDDKLIPAIKAKWELPGNRKYKKWVQKELEKGTYPEVSIKAFAFGEKSMKQDAQGILAEYPSGYEWTGFALCGKGMNKHVGHITINGEEISKSDDDMLRSNPRFNAMLQKLLIEDELPYSEAMETCKELYDDDIAKALIEKGCDEKKKKGDKKMSDDVEAIKKELEELKKTHQDTEASLNEKIESLTKENDGLKTKVSEMEKMKEGDPKAGSGKTKMEEPEQLQVIGKEEILKEFKEDILPEVLKAHKEEIKKEFKEDDAFFEEMMKARGIVKADDATPPLKSLIDLNVEKEELEQIAAKVYELNKLGEIAKNNEDETPSYEELLKGTEGDE